MKFFNQGECKFIRNSNYNLIFLVPCFKKNFTRILVERKNFHDFSLKGYLKNTLPLHTSVAWFNND